MKVTFTHPRDTTTFEAELTEACTGQEAIDGLVEADFIAKANHTNTYSLKHARTSQAIPPSQTLQSAGVKDADTVAVLLSESGARAEG